MIEVDGAYLEGGGQILRTACALSTVTGKPCRVFNIRKSRPKPGLAPQHLTGIQALSRLSNGYPEGDYPGSQEIKFHPGKTFSEDLDIKMETAGSITLVLQALLPVALSVPSPLHIKISGGATDTFFSPTIDHFRYVFLDILQKTGIRAEINVLKRGYYPQGGANVEIKIFPSKLRKIKLTKRGELEDITVISGASESLKEKKVAERQIAGAKEILRKLNLPLIEKIEYYDTSCPGSQICLIARFENTAIGADNLGKLGKSAEEVGKEAALMLLEEEKSKACLDKHLADQILPYLGLSEKKSQITVSKITDHCKTNIWVIEKFLKGKFEIRDNLITWLPEK